MVQEYFAKHREGRHTVIPDSLLSLKIVRDVTLRDGIAEIHHGTITEFHGTVTEYHGTVTEYHGPVTDVTEFHGISRTVTDVTEFHGMSRIRHGTVTEYHGISRNFSVRQKAGRATMRIRYYGFALSSTMNAMKLITSNKDYCYYSYDLGECVVTVTAVLGGAAPMEISTKLWKFPQNCGNFHKWRFIMKQYRYVHIKKWAIK